MMRAHSVTGPFLHTSIPWRSFLISTLMHLMNLLLFQNLPNWNPIHGHLGDFESLATKNQSGSEILAQKSFCNPESSTGRLKAWRCSRGVKGVCICGLDPCRQIAFPGKLCRFFPNGGSGECQFPFIPDHKGQEHTCALCQRDRWKTALQWALNFHILSGEFELLFIHL